MTQQIISLISKPGQATTTFLLKDFSQCFIPLEGAELLDILCTIYFLSEALTFPCEFYWRWVQRPWIKSFTAVDFKRL